MFPPRHSISRAKFFLNMAKQCTVTEKDDFEAYLEASIIFARAAMHRLQAQHKRHPKWKNWWHGLHTDPAVDFFRTERDWILKEGPPKVGQIVHLGHQSASLADELYYYEPGVWATNTVEKHLTSLETHMLDAEGLFV